MYFNKGNHCFLGQLVLDLYRRKWIKRNLDSGIWEWNQEAVDRAAVTDNVVTLMKSKVVELPAQTQEILEQAACAGHSFIFDELVVLTGLPSSQIVQEIRPALLTGLLLPLSGQYREVQALLPSEPTSGLSAGYQFLHDRVQQAF